MKINFEKIASDAITALVVATFLGAATIVWMGATSVDTKVKETREDVQHLIDSLSDKLADYQVKLITISNQLDSIQKNQEKMVQSANLVGLMPSYNLSAEATQPRIPLRPTTTMTTNEMNYDRIIRRGIYKDQIRQDLLPAK